MSVHDGTPNATREIVHELRERLVNLRADYDALEQQHAAALSTIRAQDRELEHVTAERNRLREEKARLWDFDPAKAEREIREAGLLGPSVADDDPEGDAERSGIDGEAAA